MLTNTVKFAAVAVLLGHSSLALAQSEVAESKGGQASRVEGTWIVTVDRINEGVTFTALQSFAGGGVALATGSIDRTPPPPISPLIGSWKRTGPNRVEVTINFFVFDLLGNAVAMIKNNETFHLDGPNDLKGSGAGFACDPHGENCVSAGSPIRITGKRLIPERVTEDISDVLPSH